MLKLVVATPDKRKLELECEPSATFAEVKSKVEAATGVPPDKQRLLCNGRERKDAAETLSAAGVGAKSKLMLMLAPGYTMPPPPGSSAPEREDKAEAAASDAPDDDGGEPLDLQGELPCPAENKAEVAGAVQVRQGRNRYRISVPQGLGQATFGQLADYLSSQMLPPGIPASECRIISKGKNVAREDVLGADAGKELSVMLMFREGFHVAVEGARWLEEKSAELAEAESAIERLAKRVEANFVDVETSMKLAEVGGVVETLTQSVDSVRVNATKLPQMRELRDRALKAAERLEGLRKRARL
eukprot:TRINITY_DN91472_c0_g1_i1.p1 TRINITY_DN91472_c0_g1~~TRINITY_DN91472_c0_g1_i1.p1  ORF type:complete len:301 (-),score=81.91 TRINITY_DN91472_c0_g1_i1:17-919(-)